MDGKKGWDRSMSVRPLAAEDFEQVLGMMKVFYASDALLIHPEEAVLRRTLQDAIGENPYVEGFALEEEGTLAGYGMVAKSYSTEAGGECVWIEDIYILPQFRGKGIGTGFLQFVQAYFSGAARIRLEAEPENEKALAVYRAAGFTELGYTQLIIDRT